MRNAIPRNQGVEKTLGGRVTAIRAHKNNVFIDLRDSSGTLQVIVGSGAFSSKSLNRGDIIKVTGKTCLSNLAEPSLMATNYEVVVRPQVYAEEDSAEAQILIDRSNLTNALRNSLTSRGLLEVETPVLSKYSGTSSINPFKTQDSEGADHFLRFTTELQLKKILIRTQLPVFEIGKIFRNHGSSSRRKTEYTSLEAYIPFANLEHGVEICEGVIKEAFDALGKKLPQIQRRSVRELCAEIPAGEDVKLAYDSKVRSLDGFMFAFYPPSDWASPLYARNEDGTVREAKLIYRSLGTIAQITEELTDYDAVRKAFDSQKAALQQVGRSVQVDVQFLDELKKGLPPCVGMYIGFDRLLAAAKGKLDIREVNLQ